MFYLDLLKNKGTDVASSDKRIQILDCYSDPPGWKDQLAGSGNFTALPNEALVSSTANVFTEVKHMDKLYNSIIELGKGLVGGGNIRFSIAIDSKSVSRCTRRACVIECTFPKGSRVLLSFGAKVQLLGIHLDIEDQISRIFWLLHSDLHEARVTAVLEYLSSMVASLEPSHQLANGQRGHLENFSLIKHNSKKGKFHVRFKKRNGRQRKFTLTVSYQLYIFAI
ncbi:3-dehydroquinate synthase [Gossypium arboreum]|uniref:Elongator complex protein 5 n=1 Tax=Gossypium arboreum TaxID=29729 RepID=A0A0B0NWK5_GOSAR|nr:3-dehydroquinate synthase [Gossypium arboreum]